MLAARDLTLGSRVYSLGHNYLLIRPALYCIAQAAEIDRQRSTGGAVGILAGVPIAIKVRMHE